MSEVAAVALWYVAIQALALAIAPLAIQVFAGLPDRGIPYSKVVGWLIVSGMVWLLGMLGLLQFTRATLIVVLVLAASSPRISFGSVSPSMPAPPICSRRRRGSTSSEVKNGMARF